MPRPVILFSGQWADLTLEDLSQRVAEWGYQGLELCCWGDHLEVQRGLNEPTYCQQKLDLLARHELAVSVVGCYRVGQAVCDAITPRHQRLLPDYVWGDGKPEGVQQRTVQEVINTIQVAQRLGVSVVSGFTGSGLWQAALGYPGLSAEEVSAGLKDFARRWNPILDACRDCGVRFALEVHPGQIAFDLHSAEMVLESLQGREEFGFTLDPSHFHWQGIDPVEFIRRFPNRIYHVHIKDVALALNGRNGLLNSYLPYGDPRRGWDFRSPGHGGIDWESFIRALNEIGYDGALAVEWKDSGMNREHGAEEACKFVKRLDFEPSRRPA
jgi:sugar phosphate isomerase/epimerase